MVLLGAIYTACIVLTGVVLDMWGSRQFEEFKKINLEVR